LIYLYIYAEIHVDISHFNKDTKQSSVTCQNAEKQQSNLVSYQQP